MKIFNFNRNRKTPQTGKGKEKTSEESGDNKVVDEFYSDAEFTRDVAWRTSNLASYTEGKFVEATPGTAGTSPIAKNAGELSSNASTTVGAARIILGYKGISEGFKKQDNMKKLEGFKELAMGGSAINGIAGTLPFIGPFGLGLWIFLLGRDLKESMKHPGVKEEMTATGWAGAAGGWLISGLSKSKTASAIAKGIGIAGTSLLAAKDTSNFIEGYNEGDHEKEANAIGSLGLDFGLMAGFLGAPVLGAGLLFAGLAPLIAYKKSDWFKGKVDKALESFDRKIMDKTYKPVRKKLDPVISPLINARDKFLSKYVDPLNEKIATKIIDKCLEKTIKTMKPVTDTVGKYGGNQFNKFIADDVIGTTDKVIGKAGKAAHSVKSVFRRKNKDKKKPS